MQILKCGEEDIARIGEFYDRVVLWLDEHVNYPEWVYKGYPSEKFVRAMTETGDQYMCLDDGKIAGAFSMNTDPQGDYSEGCWEKDLPVGSYMVLHALAVAPEEYGKGVASEIIRYSIEAAKAAGLKAVRVDIVPGNVPAKELYEKNGFRYAGDADIKRGVKHIPVFSLFELNF